MFLLNRLLVLLARFIVWSAAGLVVLYLSGLAYVHIYAPYASYRMIERKLSQQNFKKAP
jgi:hypothetical protein